MRLIAIAFLSIGMRAQPFVRFHSLPEIENLIINTGLRDNDGLLWLGSDDGILRFDGSEFKFYDTETFPDLKSNLINDLALADNGNIWIATADSGLIYFNPQTEVFRSILVGEGGMPSEKVYSLCASGKGVWAGTKAGLVWIEAVDDSWEVTVFESGEEANNISHPRVAVVIKDHLGQIWAGTKGGLNRLSADGKRIDHFLFDAENPDSLHDNEVYALFQDREKNLWVGTWGGAGISRISEAELTSKTPKFETFDDFPLTIVFAISQDAEGVIWFGSHLGLAHTKMQAETAFQFLPPKAADPFSYQLGSVVQIFPDTDGLLYFCLSQAGLRYVDTQEYYLGGLLAQNMAASVDIAPTQVLSVASVDRQTLWVSYESQVTRINPFNPGEYENLLASDLGFERTPSITNVFADPQKQWVLLGTINFGIGVYDPYSFQRLNWIPQDKSPGGLFNGTILSMEKDTAGQMWIGTYVGLYRMLGQPTDPQPTFEKIHHETIGKHLIEALAFDQDQNLWVGTSYGLFQCQTTGEIREQPLQEKGADFVLDLVTDDMDRLWAGTRNGLFLINDGKVSRPLASLRNATIKALKKDQSGRIWIASNSDLFGVDPDTFQTQSFSARDGFIGAFFARGAVDIAREGHLFFGGLEGVIFFEPNQLPARKSEVPVFLSNLLLANKRVKIGLDFPKLLHYKQKLVLKPDADMVSLDFSPLDPRGDTESLRFRLKGYNDSWLETDKKNRRATYTDLPPGSFSFEVQAKNPYGGDWGPIKKLGIKVLPTWYQTTLARTIFFAFAVLLFVAIPLLRLAHLRRRSIWLESQVDTRTKELKETNEQLKKLDQFKRNMMSMIVHDLKNPLSAILSSDRSPDPKRSLEKVRRYAKQTLNLVLNILDVQKFQDATFSIEKIVVEFDEVLMSALEDVDHLREAKDQKISLDQSGQMQCSLDPHIIERVLVNLLTNAIKFSPLRAEIHIRVLEKENRLVCEIQDSGPGIPLDVQAAIWEPFRQVEAVSSGTVRSTGLGLSFCKMAVEAHGGSVSIESEVGNGSTFCFRLPLLNFVAGQQTHLRKNQEFSCLDPEFKKILKSAVEKLQRTEIYEISQINEILSSIHADDQQILQWLDQLRRAVEQMDESSYRELLKGAC